MQKSYSPKQKALIALSAIRGEPMSKLSSMYHVHPTQIGLWKKTLEKEAEKLFTDKRKKENYSKDRVIEELYKNIGKREIEISWLKKKFNIELPPEIGFD
jgi:transposase